MRPYEPILAASYAASIFFIGTAVITLIMMIFIRDERRSTLSEISAFGAIAGMLVTFIGAGYMFYYIIGPMPMTLLGGVFGGISIGCGNASLARWRKAGLWFTLTAVCMLCIYLDPSLMDAPK